MVVKTLTGVAPGIVVILLARELLVTTMPGQGQLVTLRVTSTDRRVLEAARDVIAHAYAVVKRREGGES